MEDFLPILDGILLSNPYEKKNLTSRLIKFRSNLNTLTEEIYNPNR